MTPSGAVGACGVSEVSWPPLTIGIDGRYRPHDKRKQTLMLKRITSWSFRHRRIVVVAWIALLVSINLAAMTFGGENKQEFMSPGTDSKAAIDLLDERFPAQAGDTISIVIHDDGRRDFAVGDRGGRTVRRTGS